MYIKITQIKKVTNYLKIYKKLTKTIKTWVGVLKKLKILYNLTI